MSRKKYYEFNSLISNQKSTSGTMMTVIFGIVVFIVIFFPLYGLSLRFYIGYILKTIFDWIGRVSLTIGGFCLTVCILSIFIPGKSLNIKWAILGIALLWIGCWCTGEVLNFFGYIIGSGTSSGSSGYH